MCELKPLLYATIFLVNYNSDLGPFYVNSSRKKLQVWSSAKIFRSIPFVIQLIKTAFYEFSNYKVDLQNYGATFQITLAKVTITLQVARKIAACMRTPLHGLWFFIDEFATLRVYI